MPALSQLSFRFWFVAALTLGALHHVDHVLRYEIGRAHV